MAFGVFLLTFQNPGQIINMGPRKVPKLGLGRLTVKTIKLNLPIHVTSQERKISFIEQSGTMTAGSP